MVLERKSNIELYRILVMLSIIAHHYVVNSGVEEMLSYDNIYDWRSVFTWLFGMWGKTGINCFVLITGYYMCQSQITIRKFLKLLLEVEFYSVVIYGIFLAFGRETLSATRLFHVLCPITEFRSGFISCFLCFYLFIPFLNILIRNMSKREHLSLIGLCLLFFTIWDLLPGVEMVGYTVWFGVIYVIGAYLRLYSIENKAVNFLIGGNGVGTLICVLLSLGSVLLTMQMRHWGLCHWWPMHWVSDSDAPLAVLTSVSLFNYFRQVQIPQSKLINALGASSFGVLCIHAASDAMRGWLWHDIVDCVGHYSYWWMPMCAFASVISIYVVCTIIDRIRVYVIERPFFCIYDSVVSRYRRSEKTVN